MSFVKRSLLLIASLALVPFPNFAQSDKESAGVQLPFSDLDTWQVRHVRESLVLGGKSVSLNLIGTSPDGSQSATKQQNSPWATSNLLAKIGIDIACPCVFPEKRGSAWCGRMETTLRGVHVLGMSIDVLVTGAIFLGELVEPVTSIKAPIKKMNHGIPFTKQPKAVSFDYKCSPGMKRINSDKHGETVAGPDMAEFCIILQKRWEDGEGNVFATRIGGTREFFGDTGGKWVNGTVFRIRYGDIRKNPGYNPQTMGLIPSAGVMYVKNTKGNMVPLTEREWSDGTQDPTHLVMYFNSSYQGIDFIGSPESRFWIDNISLIY